MMFADLLYEEHYGDVHDQLVALLSSEFEVVQHGHQGDSWIWVFEEDDKVEVDTFYSMKHQVKCSNPCSTLPARVIAVLKRKYEVRVYDEPEYEAHEE
jgi:hypothetical protein